MKSSELRGKNPEELQKELESLLKAQFGLRMQDRKSTRLNSSHSQISYAVFCLKKKNTTSGSLAGPTLGCHWSWTTTRLRSLLCRPIALTCFRRQTCASACVCQRACDTSLSAR